MHVDFEVRVFGHALFLRFSGFRMVPKLISKCCYVLFLFYFMNFPVLFPEFELFDYIMILMVN